MNSEETMKCNNCEGCIICDTSTPILKVTSPRKPFPKNTIQIYSLLRHYSEGGAELLGSFTSYKRARKYRRELLKSVLNIRKKDLEIIDVALDKTPNIIYNIRKN